MGMDVEDVNGNAFAIVGGAWAPVLMRLKLKMCRCFFEELVFDVRSG